LENLVHEALKRLGGVVQAEGHEGELEYAERGSNGRDLYFVGMDGDLIVSCHQVDFREDGTTEKLMGVIMDMPDGVVVGNITGV
jgi:hypothetical protein